MTVRLVEMFFLAVVAIALQTNGARVSAAADTILSGFAHADITPDVGDDKHPVWMAGYGYGRKATGIHDPLYARGVVFLQDDCKVAIVSVDLVGLQYPTVKKIRERLADFSHVIVASTHNHEGPDTIGIWGAHPFTRGVTPGYLESVIDKVVALVRAAEQKAVAVVASYGTAKDESLLRDPRLPEVYDGVLRAVRLSDPKTGEAVGLIVQWNCHPETLGAKNRLITADFPFATVGALQAHYDCPVVYLSGAVGGLMAPPRNRIKDGQGKVLREGNFQFAQRYGEAVAKLAIGAIDQAKKLPLGRPVISAKVISIPIENRLYILARSLGVVRRTGHVWTGDPNVQGKKYTGAQPGQRVAMETEVGYVRIGELHLLCMPGELYPELVYGQFQRPASTAADFPAVPLEKTVDQLLPNSRWLLIGLANDEIGYIVPKRQWDLMPPHAYGRSSAQYGEVNSCGPDVAPIIMRALEQCIQETISNTSATVVDAAE